MCRLRRLEVEADLIDAKAGPMHVLLGEALGEVLDSLAGTALKLQLLPLTRLKTH